MARVDFDRWAACMTFDNIEPRVQAHLKNVYSCLFVALLSAATGAYIHMSEIFQLGFLTIIGSIGLMLWLYSTPHEQKNVSKRVGMLCGIGFCTGMSLGPLIDMSIRVDPSILPTAFLGTCVIFGCFSLTALWSSDRKWLYLGGTLMSVLSWMMIASFANIFLGSRMLFQANLYIGLLVFCAFVLYDTQLIIEKRRRGDDDYIWQSVDLFFDFIQVFQRLLIILTQREGENKKKNRR